MFAESSALTYAYINVKFGASRDDLMAVRKQAAKVIEGCKAAKSEVYANGPRVHGVREASRLDLLDVWETKACAVFDNCTAMLSKIPA